MKDEIIDKYKQAENALLDFIIRVAQEKTASKQELEILPEVVNSLDHIRRKV